MKGQWLFTIILFALTYCNAQWTQIGSGIVGEYLEDYSGISVSLNSDGNIVAIGAPGNDDNGNDSGHVRVYENISGVWTQIGNDIDGVNNEDNSGISVSLNSDGTIVAIGAPGNYVNGNNSGLVRVYRYINSIWEQIGDDIYGEGIGDSCSRVSISADGSIIAVGARWNDGNGNNSGHVRVYENISDVWTQIGTDIDGENEGDNSGYSISLNSDGTIVAIGAPYNNDNGYGTGHVRIYENQNGKWVKLGSDIDGEIELDNSGHSVSINSDGTIVAIGAPYNFTSIGKVRIYKYVNEVWSQIGSDINGVHSGDTFGKAVSINSDGTIVAVKGSWSIDNNTNSGQVRVYENINEDWTLINNYIEGDGAFFGYSISINSIGSILAAGNYLNNSGTMSQGVVRVFKNSSLGVNEFKNIEISFYPNPTNSIINIQNQNGLVINNITIYDTLGRKVIENKKSTESIDVTNLMAGVYFIYIYTDLGVVNKKFIKE